jgi:SH3 domain protein
MNKTHFIFAIALSICLFSEGVWATGAYVTDSLTITLRSGPSIENKIIAMLSSGQLVEVLDSRGDWSLVSLLKNGQSSKEGWVVSRYLMTRQPWERQATSLTKENTQFKEKLTALEKEFREAVRREKEPEIKLKETAKFLNKLKKEHESLKRGAAGYLKLKATNRATQSKLESTQKELEGLTEKYESLRSSQRNKWFATGAGVLLFGLIVGLVLGRQQKKRRSSYHLSE